MAESTPSAKPERFGAIYLDWHHADACPAGTIFILSEAWRRRREVCTCGMPSGSEFESLWELVTERWDQRVTADECDP